MRRLAVLALALSLAAPAAAESLLDSHFGDRAPASGGCFLRDYSRDHLAAHPDQLTRRIGLRISPLSAEPGFTLLDVFVTLRGRDEEYHGLAYCTEVGDRLECLMEGDAGGFALSGAKRGAVRLEVDAAGLSFEGQSDFVTLDGRGGDDRVFLIPNVDTDLCN